MNATELKKVALESVSPELKKIEAEMSKKAKAGELRLICPKISDAAKLFLTSQGFKIKIVIDPEKPIDQANNISISWD